jgi:hypothetical protein
MSTPADVVMIDGKQYVAIEPGWSGDARGDQAALNRIFPGEFPEVPEGSAVWVFAIHQPAPDGRSSVSSCER